MPLPKAHLNNNNYVSSCKICKLGVYRNEKTKVVDGEWSRKPIGWVHTGCLEALKAQVAEAVLGS